MSDNPTPARYYVAAGTCPGCGAASHPGRTCSGLTTEDVLERLVARPPEPEPDDRDEVER